MLKWCSAVALAFVLNGCAFQQVAFRTAVTPEGCVTHEGESNSACENVTPEISTSPAYRLHFVEFDDQGWLFPAPGDNGYEPRMGLAHNQLDAAIGDLKKRLEQGPVQLVVYVHGWKHSAYFGDSDVQKFREILTDISNLHRSREQKRQVVGIYVSWQGNSVPSSEPWSNITFWARKQAALRVASGSVRELFARIRALRTEWNPDTPGQKTFDARFRALTIGHSFGAQIAFASLSPSIISDLAMPIGNDREAWRRSRLRQTMDLTVLLNPAFEASAYAPLDRLAREFDLQSQYEPPVLVTVTTMADWATGDFFPIGRAVSTVFQRPFTSAEQGSAVIRTPGFSDIYRTHTLTVDEKPPPALCPGWRAKPEPDGNGVIEETAAERSNRDYQNIKAEAARQKEWATLVSGWPAMPDNWSWPLCGNTKITRLPGQNHADMIWNVQTFAPISTGHNDITGDALVSFLRQVYLDVIDPLPVKKSSN